MSSAVEGEGLTELSEKARPLTLHSAVFHQDLESPFSQRGKLENMLQNMLHYLLVK